MSDAVEEIEKARETMSWVIDGNMLRGEHVARAKMIEQVLAGLADDVKEGADDGD